MADNEEQENGARGIEELRYMQQVYQNQYAAINNAMNMHLQEVQMLGAVQNTLENNDMMKGKEALMHVGASVYMKTEMRNVSMVVVSIGGGYLIEKGIAEAKAYVSGRLAKKNELLNSMAKSRKELQNTLIDISYKMEQAIR